MSGGVGLQIPKRQSKTIHQGWEHQVWGSRQTLVISMWSSSVFWKDSLSVIHIPFTFQVFFSFQVKSTFIINCSIVFTEHNHQELCFLWRHRFTASPSCNSSPSLQLGKPEGQHRHVFQEPLRFHQLYRSFWIQCPSERRPCGLLTVSVELLTQKICNTQERPS